MSDSKGWVPMAIFLLAAAAIDCDPLHGISITAVPKKPLDSGCVATALAPIGAVRRSWCCEDPPAPRGVDLYAIDVEFDNVLIDVPVASGATEPAVELSWSTIRAPSEAHVAAIRSLIETAYQSLRRQCGGLPELAEATHGCWRMGCRG